MAETTQGWGSLPDGPLGIVLRYTATADLRTLVLSVPRVCRQWRMACRELTLQQLAVRHSYPPQEGARSSTLAVLAACTVSSLPRLHVVPVWIYSYDGVCSAQLTACADTAGVACLCVQPGVSQRRRNDGSVAGVAQLQGALRARRGVGQRRRRRSRVAAGHPHAGSRRADSQPPVVLPGSSCASRAPALI